MKKLISLFVSVLLFIGMTACSKGATSTSSAPLLPAVSDSDVYTENPAYSETESDIFIEDEDSSTLYDPDEITHALYTIAATYADDVDLNTDVSSVIVGTWNLDKSENKSDPAQIDFLETGAFLVKESGQSDDSLTGTYEIIDNTYVKLVYDGSDVFNLWTCQIDETSIYAMDNGEYGIDADILEITDSDYAKMSHGIFQAYKAYENGALVVDGIDDKMLEAIFGDLDETLLKYSRA